MDQQSNQGPAIPNLPTSATKLRTKVKWGFVLTVIISLVGLLIAYKGLPKHPGEIAVTITYADEFLSRLRSIGDKRLTVVWGDPGSTTSLTHCCVTNITIKNVGGEPFVWTERVTESLRFEGPPDSEMLGIGEPYAQDNGRIPRFTYRLADNRKEVAIATDYLNPGEELRFALYHTGSSPYPLSVGGRIKGQSRIAFTQELMLPPPGYQEVHLYISLLLCGFVTSVGLGLAVLHNIELRCSLWSWIISILAIVAILLLPQLGPIYLPMLPGARQPSSSYFDQATMIFGMLLCSVALFIGSYYLLLRFDLISRYGETPKKGWFAGVYRRPRKRWRDTKHLWAKKPEDLQQTAPT